MKMNPVVVQAAGVVLKDQRQEASGEERETLTADKLHDRASLAPVQKAVVLQDRKMSGVLQTALMI
jgi:hypothetical protein